MRRHPLLLGILLGVYTGLTVVALLYLGERIAGLPFVPFDIFDWMARVLPGGLVITTIELIVKVIGSLNLGPTASTAKTIEQAIAIIQLVIGGAVLGALLAYLGRRKPARLDSYGLISGLILWAVTLAIEFAAGFPGGGLGSSGMIFAVLWLGIVFIGWGMILSRLLLISYSGAVSALESRPVPESAPTQEEGLSRRQFLYLVGAGSFVVLVSALGISVFNNEGEGQASAQSGGTQLTFNPADTSGPAASPPKDVLEKRVLAAPGTRPELTSTDDFYRIDINALPVEIDQATWRLELDGMVEKPLSLTLDEIRARPSFSQVITLECISNNIGGDLISTAEWTGISLKDLLAEAGLKPGANALFIEAADGYYETVVMEDMMDERTMLVYAMNGAPLTASHGFPLRIYIPNHYGMKQPKWITHIQVTNKNQAGYWVVRGWNEQAIPKTTSVIDAIDTDQMDPNTHIVPIGGIAYAGARGISKVEMQVDDGPWQAAVLRDPPLSPLSWVQWRFDWQASEGRHILRVRAYDGSGALQETNLETPFPNGATGVDTKNAIITV
jgi:DMSO/TMAO reductase YedYZ molybdopterin-dependent catalytic subunit